MTGVKNTLRPIPLPPLVFSLFIVPYALFDLPRFTITLLPLRGFSHGKALHPGVFEKRTAVSDATARFS